MSGSLKEYIATLGYWSILMIAAAVLDVLGVIQIATGKAGGALPGWIVISIAFVIALVVPFIAFHRMRLVVVAVNDVRCLELKRLIVQVKDTTHKLITKFEIIASGMITGVSLEPERIAWDNAVSVLRIEADVEGGNTKKVINDFLYFATYHAMQFVETPHTNPASAGTWKGKDDVPDSWHFMARLQEKADEVIDSLSQ